MGGTSRIRFSQNPKFPGNPPANHWAFRKFLFQKLEKLDGLRGQYWPALGDRFPAMTTNELLKAQIILRVNDGVDNVLFEGEIESQGHTVDTKLPGAHRVHSLKTGEVVELLRRAAVATREKAMAEDEVYEDSIRVTIEIPSGFKYGFLLDILDDMEMVDVQAASAGDMVGKTIVDYYEVFHKDAGDEK